MDYTGNKVTEIQINKLRKYLDSLPNNRNAPKDIDNYSNRFERMPKL